MGKKGSKNKRKKETGKQGITRAKAYTTPLTPTSSTVWDLGEDIVEGPYCPYANVGRITLLVPYSLYRFLVEREEKVHSEYLLYTDYEELEPGVYKLTNPYIPRQKATSAHVDVEESVVGRKAVIHRHPHGLDRFSSTDFEYINRNNDLSILYVDKKFPVATLRKTLPCGKIMITETRDIEVLVLWEDDWKEKTEELHRRAGEAIAEQVYEYSYRGSLYEYPSTYSYDYSRWRDDYDYGYNHKYEDKYEDEKPDIDDVVDSIREMYEKYRKSGEGGVMDFLLAVATAKHIRHLHRVDYTNNIIYIKGKTEDAGNECDAIIEAATELGFDADYQSTGTGCMVHISI